MLTKSEIAHFHSLGEMIYINGKDGGFTRVLCLQCQHVYFSSSLVLSSRLSVALSAPVALAREKLPYIQTTENRLKASRKFKRRL